MKSIEQLQNYAKSSLPYLFEKDGSIPILFPIDNGSSEKLIQYSNAKLKWNPLRFDWLFAESWKDLNTCLNLRASGQNLEVQAVNQILSDNLNSKELEIQKDITAFERENQPTSSLISNQKEILMSEDRITTLSGSAESIESAAKVNSRVLDFTERKNDASERYVESLNYQRGIKGSGLNIRERFGQVLSVFDLKLVDLYFKLHSLKEGLKYIYPDSVDEINEVVYPELKDTGYLLSIQEYLISLQSKVQEIQQYEQDFTLIFNLNKEFYIDNIEKRLYKDDAAFADSITEGKFSFNLPNELFDESRYKNLRLQGLDVVIVKEDATSTLSIPFFITPPKMLDNKDNQLCETPRYSLNAYHSLAKGVSDAYYSDQLLTNRTLKGKWSLETDKSPYVSAIKDLRVYFYVTARIL